MSAGKLFSLRDQAPTAEEQARLHAAADKALADAEYEFYALQAAVQAALEVPLRDRAVRVGPAPEAEATESSESRPSLAARIASAAA
jgi:hypothetical protein